MNPFSVLIKPDLNRPRPFHKVYDREAASFIPLPDVRPQQKLILPPPTLDKRFSDSRQSLVSLLSVLSETNDADTEPQFLIPTTVSRNASMRRPRESASSSRSSSPRSSSSFRRNSAPSTKRSRLKSVSPGSSTPKPHLEAAQAAPPIFDIPDPVTTAEQSRDSVDNSMCEAAQEPAISTRASEPEFRHDVPKIVVHVAEPSADDVEAKQQLDDSGALLIPDISESSSVALSSVDDNSPVEYNSPIEDSNSQFSLSGDTAEGEYLPCFPSAALQTPAFSRSQSVSSQHIRKKTGQVHVHVVSASHLKPFGMLRPKLHPFVRVVLGEGRDARTCESRPQKGNSPAFHETMHFELLEEDFEGRLLFFVANSEQDRQPIIGKCFVDLPTPEKLYNEEHAIFRDDKVTGYLKLEIQVFVDTPGQPSARIPETNKTRVHVPSLSFGQIGAMAAPSELIVL